MRVVLTNDHEANDTYAGANNDPESYLKTAAYIDAQSDEARVVTAGQALHLTGTAIVGWPGLDRVEYWLRPLAGNHGHLADDDPAWSTAAWKPCRIELPPADWSESLPAGAKAGAIWGFDRATGNPRAWPMRFSVALWAAELPPLPPGGYEFRVRTVDQNGFAQPQPRPGGQSGRNLIQCQELLATS
jgi:hypothetical protein